MFAAVGRRQPRDRIDYDSVSDDNEPVTRTEGGGGQSQHFPPVFGGVLLFFFFVCVWQEGSMEKISLKSPTFCICHWGWRVVGALIWLNRFNQDGDKMRKAADSAAFQERGPA